MSKASISIAPIKAPALRPGDTIAIIAPGDRPQGLAEAQRAYALVERLGFKAQTRFNLAGRHSAWDAPDTTRAAVFMEAWCDERVRALWVLRGGWGAARLLPLLDY